MFPQTKAPPDAAAPTDFHMVKRLAARLVTLRAAQLFVVCGPEAEARVLLSWST